MLGNRASLPAALIREERQCHAKAGLTERPLKAGTGDDISWDGNGPPEATPRPHDHRSGAAQDFQGRSCWNAHPFADALTAVRHGSESSVWYSCRQLRGGFGSAACWHRISVLEAGRCCAVRPCLISHGLISHNLISHAGLAAGRQRLIERGAIPALASP